MPDLHLPELDEARELDEHRRVRLAKLEELERRGIDPYPIRVERTHSAEEALAAFHEGAAEQATVCVAGRIITQLKRFGKLIFCHLTDRSGRIQAAFRFDVLGREQFEILDLIETGDFLSVRGPLFKTKTGEITIEARAFAILSKALRPLPEKWHGLTDVEKRYRQRYLDLIANPRARDTFIARSRVVAAIRRYLDTRCFLEVETPILQPVYGGAAARPFETYHNAAERRLFLRIATELYLKRLIVGGLDRVYEIGRNFRNEGLSTKHNPEFTVLESYQAYADYRDVMVMTEEMVAAVAHDVLGTTRVTYKGSEIEFQPPWRRITLADAVFEHTGVDIAGHPTVELLAGAARRAGLPVAPEWNRGKLVDELVSTFVEPRLIQPTFLVDYPIEFPGSILAKRVPGRDDLVERFEGYVGGFEICNAFTELNDPRDQRARFEEQAEMGRGGDDEAHPMDEDYITALEHGMPPTGGLGVGIDRLTMLLTDQHSIREVILFPQLREAE
ncbi:MAG: lysine--tRNA ligase [Chloroflexota bacterium]|nr:MAG: lysine--tRNA ligase [Chloroflexota bacterium]